MTKHNPPTPPRKKNLTECDYTDDNILPLK